MKHAFLFIAHNNFSVLHKALLLLDSQNIDFFIHIDNKAAGFSPETLTEGIQHSHIKWLPRVNVEWGADTMIRCEMDLLALALPGGYDYYHLLSGADFPIKSRAEIERYFEDHCGLEFVSFRERPTDMPSVMRRITGYCPHPDHYRRYPLIRKAENFLNRYYHRKLLYPPKDYRFGANWFSITRGLAAYVLAHREETEHQYRRTLCCDEVFLQTLVYNSPFREHVYGGTDHYDFRYCLRKIDWERGTPYTFRLGDYDELLHAGEDFLFARKFDEKTDPAIVELLFEALSNKGAGDK